MMMKIHTLQLTSVLRMMSELLAYHYQVRKFKWKENLGKVPAKVYRLVSY